MKKVSYKKIMGYLTGLFVSSDRYRGITHDVYSKLTDDFLSESCAFSAILLIGLLIETNKSCQNQSIEQLGFRVKHNNNANQPTLKTIRNAIFHHHIWQEGNKIQFKDKRPNEDKIILF